MSEDYSEKKLKRKYEANKPEVEVTETIPQPKSKLQELYEQRPIFVGVEYNKLHLWYAELEKLLQ